MKLGKISNTKRFQKEVLNTELNRQQIYEDFLGEKKTFKDPYSGKDVSFFVLVYVDSVKTCKNSQNSEWKIVHHYDPQVEFFLKQRDTGIGDDVTLQEYR